MFRQSRNDPLSRRSLYLIPLITFALVFGCGFLFLSTWISRLITHNFVNLRSVNCGYWRFNISGFDQLGTASQLPGTEELYTLLNELSEWASNGTESTAAYVRQCYGDNSENSNCAFMLSRRITWNATHNDRCPFSQGQCIGGDNGALTMDTGNVSFTSLGVNAITTLTFRRRTTCSPIVMHPYSVENSSVSGGTYSHGKSHGMNITQSVRDDTAAA
jgi:hypothetical protein